ncbi:MAG: hypothetical protein LBE13_07840 [Bacteroidales bacterium]|jgi:hypothetical protein|nr:hypothetical protein [Bacteroidales bacterium]
MKTSPFTMLEYEPNKNYFFIGNQRLSPLTLPKTVTTTLNDDFKQSTDDIDWSLCPRHQKVIRINRNADYTTHKLFYNDNMREIRYDVYVYPLLCSIQLIGKEIKSNLFKIYTEFFNHEICGTGKTIDDAAENWKYKFHIKFQQLRSKRRWEHTEEEKELWNKFEKIVDMPEYRQQTPLIYQQTGQIIKYAGRPRRLKFVIKWIDDRSDIISVKNCPKELLRYKCFQYFRANVLQDYQTGKLIKILSVEPQIYKKYSAKELKKFWASIQTIDNT